MNKREINHFTVAQMLLGKKINIYRKTFTVFLLFLCLLLFTACDPVIYFHPKDWSKEDIWFTKSFGEFDIKITELGGITANDSLTPEIIINNQGKVSVILEKAILKTGEGEYFAHPFDEKGWEAVSPSSNRRFALQYDFRKSVGNILKEPVEIILILKIGENSTKLSIPMIKSESEKP